jgi:general secretion pathway protein D
MTLGVGGLISDYTQSVEDKVPIMGDVPYLGRFFRTKADQFFKKNLMMFVTVNLVDPSGQRVNQNRFVNPSGLEAPPPTAEPGPALMPDIPPDNLK